MNCNYRIRWSAPERSLLSPPGRMVASQLFKNTQTIGTLSAIVIFGVSMGGDSYAANYTSTVNGDFTFPSSESNSVIVTQDQEDAVRANNGTTVTSTTDLFASTAGLLSSGIAAENSGIVNITNANVETTNTSSYDLYAFSSGVVNSTGSIFTTSTGSGAFGIVADNFGVINLFTADVTTNGQGAHGLYASRNGNITSTNGITLLTGGNNSYGVYALTGGVVTLSDMSVTTTGDNSAGVVIDGAGSQVHFNGGNIITSGANSHGISVINGASKSFDGTPGNILPSIAVSGGNSALLNVDGAGSQINLSSQTLDISQTTGLGTWGGIASNGGELLIQGGGTGGTGLWATGSGSTVRQSNDANLNGSRVKLDTGGMLIADSPNISIGSLEGDASANVNATTAGSSLTIGSNNTGNNGSLINNAAYAGIFTGIGLLNKSGQSTQILTGAGNVVGSVDVLGGTLRFEQAGAFSTTGNYATGTGGTTDIGLSDSSLVVGGVFSQMPDSVLQVTIGSAPDITANTASLAGQLNINGFSETAPPVLASEVGSNTYTIIHTTNGISGNFSNNPLTPTGLDYLLQDGHISANGLDYNLGFRMAWNEGGQTDGTGTFTVNESTAFNVDTILSDETVPAGGFASNWDGKSLTKAGNGLLVLSGVNTYTGNTIVTAGTLRTDAANSVANSSSVNVNGGVLDLNGYDQAFNRLGGTGGEVRLNGARLTVINPALADSSTYSGVITDGSIAGSLLKSGDGTLTLNGSNTYTGGTTISAGTLQLGDGSASGSLQGAIIDNATLAINNPGATTLGGNITGTGTLVHEGSGTTTLTAANSSLGNVEVSAGTLSFKQSGMFTTTGDYTTRSGGITDIVAGSPLNIGNTFAQEASSTLSITLGDNSVPLVSANNAKLDGNLQVKGFSAKAGVPLVKSSALSGTQYTIIHTDTGITGDFANNPAGTLLGSPDYLVGGGQVSGDGKDYNLGFALSWTNGRQTQGTGTFTLAQDTGFEVDTVLADQSGSFDSGWDGKSLTKAGDGLLVLSAINTYTGTTTLDAGTLRSDVADTIATSSALMINGGVFDLNGNNQRVNNLSGSGGEISLSAATLTATNASTTDNTLFAGNIIDGNVPGGSLVKAGEGSLTLEGTTGWTGDTHIDGGTLVLDGSKGGAQLVSNIIGQEGTTLTLQNGASLTGWIDPENLNIDSASLWNMSADSVLNNVDLGGTINFETPAISPMRVGRTLTVTNWNGQNGTVALNTVLGGDSSVTDKIVVNGNTSGNTYLRVNNVGGVGAQTVEGIQVVKVNGQSDGTFTRSGRIVAGAYDYNVVKKGTDWYLSSFNNTPPVIPTTPNTPAEESAIRPEAGSYTANLAAANTMFVTRLHDRLGETQYTDVLSGEKKVTSLWLRQVGGHSSWKDGSGQTQTQANRYVVQLGGDLAQWTPDGLQRWHIGMMGGYGNSQSNTHSSPTGNRAEGQVSGYSVGLYATWYQNDETKQGVYADTWAQYGWFNNDVKGQNIEKESYDSDGTSASLELGYTHRLGEFSGSQGGVSEWFIQPQAQVVWMGVKGNRHRESNGTLVSDEGDGNLQTRLGVRTYLEGHSRADDGKYRTFQPYVEVNWLHNTDAFGVQMDDVAVHQAGARNVGEVKTGVEGQLNTRLSLWGNVGVQMGGKGYSDVSAILGAKYSF